MGYSSVIIGGDWNMVENIQIDELGGNVMKGNEGLHQLNSLKQTFDLSDSFRLLNKKDKVYAWSCDATGIRTRLDRIYINKNIREKIKNVEHISCHLSDHWGVLLELVESPELNFELGKGIWEIQY